MPFIPLKERETLLRAKQQTRRPKLPYLEYPKAKQGIVVFVVFFIAALASAVGEPMDGAAAPSLFLISMLAIAALIGLLVPWLLHRSYGLHSQRHLVMREVQLERAQRVAMELQRAQQGRASLRELRAHLRWTEDATVDGLRAAMDRGLVFEDYDGATMQYFYVSAAAYLSSVDDHAAFDARLYAEAPAPVAARTSQQVEKLETEAAQPSDAVPDRHRF